MATSADTRRERVAPAGSPSGSSLAPLGPTLALTVTLAVACFVIVLAPVELLVQPTALPPPLELEQHQRAETALFLLSFGLILPLAVVAVPRLADRIAATPNAPALPLLAATLVAGFAASIVLARVLAGGGVVVASSVVGAWSLGAAALLARARRPRPWTSLLRAARLAPAFAIAAAGLALAALLSFADLGSIGVVPLAVGLAAVPALVALYARGSVRVPRRWGAAGDAGVVLLLLAIPDLVIFRAVGAARDPLASFKTSVIQAHQDYVLGPANVVLHGGAMLVDAASQYGIGSIYFLAAWFQLAPIGYGTLGFLDGVLFVLVYATGYALLRLAGTPRLLAAGAVAIGVIVLIYNLVYPVGGLPAQHGPLRYGIPMLLILAAVAEARWPTRRAAAVAQPAVVGLASIWALEAFTYTTITFLALDCFQAWTRPAGRRLAWLGRRILWAAAACVAVQLLFVAATLVFRGELPDYGWYLAFLRSFLFGDVGELTYDFSRWSPGLAVGAAYAASAAAFLLVVQRRRELLQAERTAMVALCGITAYGIVLFSYFVNRSADHVLPYVCLPALLAGTLWLSLLLRGALGDSRGVRLGGLAFALALSALLVSVAWSSIGERYPHSALAHVIPGGDSVGSALHRLWHPPALDPRTPQGERLVARYMPHQSRILTFMWPDLENEIMIRTDRRNRLPLSFPPEDSFVSGQYIPDLRRSVDELRAGDNVLVQRVSLRVFAALQAQPSRNPLVEPVAPESLAPLQEWALQRIGRRFDLKLIHRDPEGVQVATLVPRR